MSTEKVIFECDFGTVARSKSGNLVVTHLGTSGLRRLRIAAFEQLERLAKENEEMLLEITRLTATLSEVYDSIDCITTGIQDVCAPEIDMKDLTYEDMQQRLECYSDQLGALLPRENGEA